MHHYDKWSVAGTGARAIDEDCHHHYSDKFHITMIVQAATSNINTGYNILLCSSPVPCIQLFDIKLSNNFNVKPKGSKTVPYPISFAC